MTITCPRAVSNKTQNFLLLEFTTCENNLEASYLVMYIQNPDTVGHRFRYIGFPPPIQKDVIKQMPSFPSGYFICF